MYAVLAFVSRPGALLAALWLGVSACGVAAQEASPEPDPIGQLLSDRGLPSTTPSGRLAAPAHFGEQVRDKASEMVLTAMNFLGVPYKRGGSSGSAGFDCSGFTRHVFETTVGLVLPRRVDEQASAPGLVPVRHDELKPGDLVFFNTLKRTFSHVGIYVGEGRFIHSPRAGGEVRVEQMNLSYWRKRFTGARRAETLVAQAAAAHAPSTLSAAPGP